MESATVEKPDLGESDGRPTKRQRTASPPDVKAVSLQTDPPNSAVEDTNSELSHVRPSLPGLGLIDASAAEPDTNSSSGDHLLNTLMRIVESQAKDAVGESQKLLKDEAPIKEAVSRFGSDEREPAGATEVTTTSSEQKVIEVEEKVPEQTEQASKEEAPMLEKLSGSGLREGNSGAEIGATTTSSREKSIDAGQTAINQTAKKSRDEKPLSESLPSSVPGEDDHVEAIESTATPSGEKSVEVDEKAVEQIENSRAECLIDGSTLLNGDSAAILAEEEAPPEQASSAPLTLTSPDMATIREELPAINEDSHMQEETHGPMQDEGAEWEVDSSPLSSDTSDTSTDSDSDVDVDDDYAMLDPEEQARILSLEDGGSDDDGPHRRPKTQNEKPEEVIEKPDIQVTEEMKIEELGAVEAVVENSVLIKAKISGEYQVLESNSLLCLQDRSVIGVISETLGRVQQPLYTVHFTNDAAIQEAGVADKGTRIFYVVPHSTFVFTQPLRSVKGSDASNLYDEEIGAHEAEFSDDEAEARHKRELKQKKQGRRDLHGERNPSRGGSMNGRRGGHANANQVPEMNYDDIPAGDDGYTPLARPTNLHEMMSGEAPVEGLPPPFSPPSFDRGRARGRSDRSRSHRGRGRGRGWDRSSEQRPFTNPPAFQPQAQPNGPSPSLPFSLPPLPPISPSPYPMHQFPAFPAPDAPHQQPYIHIPSAPTISPLPNGGSYPPISPSPISPLPQSGVNFPYAPFPAGYQHQSTTVSGSSGANFAANPALQGPAGFAAWNGGGGGQMGPNGGQGSFHQDLQRGGRRGGWGPGRRRG